MAGASRLLAVRSGSPKEEIEYHKGQYRLVTRLANIANPRERRKQALGNVHITHRNSVFFLTLLLSSSLTFLRRRWQYLCVAFALLFASQVIDATFLSLIALGAVYAEVGAPFLSDGLMATIGSVHVIYSTTIAFLVPFALFAPAWFLTPRAIPAQKQPVSEPIARNAPCPCGSGKKYKQCCGR